MSPNSELIPLTHPVADPSITAPKSKPNLLCNLTGPVDCPSQPNGVLMRGSDTSENSIPNTSTITINIPPNAQMSSYLSMSSTINVDPPSATNIAVSMSPASLISNQPITKESAFKPTNPNTLILSSANSHTSQDKAQTNSSDSQCDFKTCQVKTGEETTIEIVREKLGLGLSIVGGSDTPLVRALTLISCKLTILLDL